MNEVMEEGKRRCHQLIRDDYGFRKYICQQEQAALEAFGRELDDETRYALAVMWRGDRP